MVHYYPEHTKNGGAALRRSLYSYILNEQIEVMTLWEKTFIGQCYYSKLMKKEKIEEATKVFVKNGCFSMNGLKLLESINSSYTEKYKSYLLMEEMKND